MPIPTYFSHLIEENIKSLLQWNLNIILSPWCRHGQNNSCIFKSHRHNYLHDLTVFHFKAMVSCIPRVMFSLTSIWQCFVAGELRSFHISFHKRCLGRPGHHCYFIHMLPVCSSPHRGMCRSNNSVFCSLAVNVFPRFDINDMKSSGDRLYVLLSFSTKAHWTYLLYIINVTDALMIYWG